MTLITGTTFSRGNNIIIQASVVAQKKRLRNVAVQNKSIPNVFSTQASQLTVQSGSPRTLTKKLQILQESSVSSFLNFFKNFDSEQIKIYSKSLQFLGMKFPTKQSASNISTKKMRNITSAVLKNIPKNLSQTAPENITFQQKGVVVTQSKTLQLKLESIVSSIMNGLIVKIDSEAYRAKIKNTLFVGAGRINRPTQAVYGIFTVYANRVYTKLTSWT
jgi:hypothetical protein